MIRIPFTPEEIKALDYERYHHPHPIVQRKMTVVYLKSQGVSHKEIARLAGVKPNSVTRHLKAYKDGGIERLKKINIYRPRSALQAYRSSLEAHFRAHPPATIKEAVHEIERQTGIKRSETQVRAFFQSVGLARRKVGMVPAKADVAEQETFKKNI